MAPVFWRLTTTPVGLINGLWIATFLLTALIVLEGLRAQPRRLKLSLIQAALFLLLASGAVVALPMVVWLPDRIEIPLRSWGLFSAIGMFLGFLIQRTVAKARGIDLEHVFTLWIYGGLSGLVLGRALHVAVNWPDYAATPLRALAVTDGGLVWLGALLGYLIFAVVYALFHRLDLRLFDAIAVGLPFGHAFGRVGCYFAGCCWGRPTELFLGVHFPPESLAYLSLVERGLLPAGSAQTPLLHPTQLYEVTFNLLLGALLLLRARQQRDPPGALVCLYLMLYSVGRMVIEMLREDPDRSFLFRIPAELPLLLSTSQALSVAMIGLGGWAWWRLSQPSAS